LLLWPAKIDAWVNFETSTDYTNKCHTKRMGRRKRYFTKKKNQKKEVILPARRLDEGER